MLADFLLALIGLEIFTLWLYCSYHIILEHVKSIFRFESLIQALLSMIILTAYMFMIIHIISAIL